MRIAAMTFRLHAPWVHSLKEKRMIVKSLIAKLQNKFHVSAAEVDEQDTHTTAVDEAMDALDDAVDILEDAVDTVEETL